MFNLGDLLAAGGFWAAFAAMYHAGLPALQGVLGDINMMIRIMGIWIGRNLARAYRKVYAVVAIEILIAVVVVWFFDRFLIHPQMVAQGTRSYAGISGEALRTAIFVWGMVVPVLLMLIGVGLLSVKKIELGDIVASIAWEVGGFVPADEPDPYYDHDAREAELGRLNTVTVLIPAVVPIVLIAAGSMELMVLGSAYGIGFFPYLIGLFVEALMMYIHVVLTRKIGVEIATKAVGAVAEAAAKLLDELSRRGLAGAILGITVADINARLQPVTVPILAGIEVIRERLASIEVAIMVFYATASAFYGHAPFLVAAVMTAIAFIVTSAIDPAYVKTNQSYEHARQLGVRMMNIIIFGMIAFQLFVEVAASHVHPRPTVLYYVGAVIHVVDAVIHNPISWVLFMVACGTACYYKWSVMPTWLRRTVVGTICLLAMVVVGKVSGTDVRVERVVSVGGPRVLNAPPTTVDSLTRPVVNTARQVTSQSTPTPAPAPVPARRPSRGRPVNTAENDVGVVPPCPSGSGATGFRTRRAAGSCR